MKQELKPCPMCTSKAEFRYNRTLVKVVCSNEDCQCNVIWRGSKEDALHYWNIRAYQTLSDDAFDALENENEKLKAKIAELEKVKEVDWKHLELKIVERLVGCIDLSIPSNTCPKGYSRMIKTAIDIADATIFQLKKQSDE